MSNKYIFASISTVWSSTEKYQCRHKTYYHMHRVYSPSLITNFTFRCTIDILL